MMRFRWMRDDVGHEVQCDFLRLDVSGQPFPDGIIGDAQHVCGVFDGGCFVFEVVSIHQPVDEFFCGGYFSGFHIGDDEG